MNAFSSYDSVYNRDGIDLDDLRTLPPGRGAPARGPLQRYKLDRTFVHSDRSSITERMI